jgi:hypothetical protein
MICRPKGVFFVPLELHADRHCFLHHPKKNELAGRGVKAADRMHHSVLLIAATHFADGGLLKRAISIDDV